MRTIVIIVFKLLIILFLIASGTIARGQDKWQRVVDLEGDWKFAIGNRPGWSDRYYNDSQWEKIEVPSAWEEQGFNGYDGFAWYRTTFSGTELKNNGIAYSLFLGYIDDVDEAYFNGHKIGTSGGFPPHYATAHDAFRNYSIPNEFVDFTGRNVVAVKVYDAGINGGILSGDVGIYFNPNEEGLAVNLRGMWDFRVAGRHGFGRIDEIEASAVQLNNAGWVDVMVPRFWEDQGFPGYDGGAWYRRKFIVPPALAGTDLMLIMGKIDDSDKTYLNGHLIGATENHHDRLRTYALSADEFKAGQTNTLLIYVDDTGGTGGVYEGPVGLMKQSDFTRFIRWRK